MAFSPDGKKIVSSIFDPSLKAPGDATVKVCGTHRAVHEEPWPSRGPASEVWSAAFSPDGKKIVTGGRDFMVTLWDATSGQKTLTLARASTGMVLSVAFSPNGKTIVSGSMDKTLRVWDSASGQETLTVPQTHFDGKSIREVGCVALFKNQPGRQEDRRRRRQFGLTSTLKVTWGMHSCVPVPEESAAEQSRPGSWARQSQREGRMIAAARPTSCGATFR